MTEYEGEVRHVAGAFWFFAVSNRLAVFREPAKGVASFLVISTRPISPCPAPRRPSSSRLAPAAAVLGVAEGIERLYDE
jgi:hypothetical protein